MVNVYANRYGEGEIIARVNYNTNLDYWDGRNMSNGGVGYHKGLTKLRDGSFVIIEGTNWQGGTDIAYICTKEEALQEILESGNDELLEKKRFAELKELYEEKFANAEVLEEE